MLLPVTIPAGDMILVPSRDGLTKGQCKARARQVQDHGRFGERRLPYASPDVANQANRIAAHSDHEARNRQFDESGLFLNIRFRPVGPAAHSDDFHVTFPLSPVWTGVSVESKRRSRPSTWNKPLKFNEKLGAV